MIQARKQLKGELSLSATIRKTVIGALLRERLPSGNAEDSQTADHSPCRVKTAQLGRNNSTDGQRCGISQSLERGVSRLDRTHLDKHKHSDANLGSLARRYLY
jgi:hypothetical protein